MTELSNQSKRNIIEFSNKAKIIFTFLFVVYFLILIKIVLLKEVSITDILNGEIMTFSSYNIIPFYTFYDLIQWGTVSFRALANIAGNVVIFAPLGFLLPIIIGKLQRISYILFVGFLLSTFFELIQYIFKIGSSDIDDIILNVLGCAIGYWIFLGFVHFFGNGEKFYVATLILILLTGTVSFYVAYNEFGQLLGLNTHEIINVGDEHIPEREADFYGSLVKISAGSMSVCDESDETEKNKEELFNITFTDETKFYVFNAYDEGNFKTIFNYDEQTSEEILNIKPDSYLEIWYSDSDKRIANIVVVR